MFFFLVLTSKKESRTWYFHYCLSIEKKDTVLSFIVSPMVVWQISSFNCGWHWSITCWQVLESALTCMFEARHVPVDELGKDNPKICDKYWSQLQKLLKKMLSVSLCATKSSANSQHNASSKSADAGKLRELYKMSLKYTDFSQLQVMHDLWTS